MQHGNGHGVWTWTWSMDVVMQHGQRCHWHAHATGHGHGHGHAVQTWTGSMGMNVDKQHVHIQAACLCYMFMSMLHVHIQPALAWTWTCSVDMDMQHGYSHAAWKWTLSMYRDIQHGHGHESWSNTCYIYAACPWPCCMFMSMLHVHVHAACPSTCYVVNPFWNRFPLIFQIWCEKNRPTLLYSVLYMLHHGTTSETSPARLCWESSRGISAKPNTNVSGFWCYVLDIRSLTAIDIVRSFTFMNKYTPNRGMWHAPCWELAYWRLFSINGHVTSIYHIYHQFFFRYSHEHVVIPQRQSLKET